MLSHRFLIPFGFIVWTADIINCTTELLFSGVSAIISEAEATSTQKMGEFRTSTSSMINNGGERL